MSDHGNSMDMPAHNAMYSHFITLVKFTTIGIIGLLVIMAITLL